MEMLSITRHRYFSFSVVGSIHSIYEKRKTENEWENVTIGLFSLMFDFSSSSGFP